MVKKAEITKKIIKIIVSLIGKVLLAFVLFFALLAIGSADWFLKTFGAMDFSIVIYQLFSPMEGTSSEILAKYCSDVLIPTSGITITVMLMYIFCDIIFRKCFVKVGIAFGNREIKLSIHKKTYLISKWIILVTGLIGLFFVLISKAVAVGIPEYLEEVRNSSTLFEDEYVNPKDTKIEFPESERNLILIYLESMESTYASTSEGGAKPINYIPELTDLAKNNLNFSDSDKLGGGHVYTEGWTMAGLLGSSTGVPYKLPVEGNSAGEYEQFLPGITGLGDILQEAGYKNYFMCGSDATFGGREAFYSQHGDYEILDYDRARVDGFIPMDYQVYWGMEDEKLYSYAREELTKIGAEGQPFNFTMLTVDTHHPDGYICELCDNEYPEQYANAIVCASKQATDFVKWIQQQDWYENTTVIIMGDHTSMNNNFWDDIGDYERTIYNCFINYPDSVSAVNPYDREFSTLDMFPTILAALGVKIDGERLGLGVNLFSGEKTLPEKMGKDAYITELRKFSYYYFNEFVVG